MSRISPATMTAAIFAILVGLLGAYGVRQYLSQTSPEVAAVEEETPEPPKMVYIPVAARSMQIGQTVNLSDVIVNRVEQAKFGSSKYVGMRFMRDTEHIFGKKLQVALEKGDVFMPELFYPEGMGPSVTRMLKPGHRAVTIPIRNVGAVEGFATPGTLVDVLFRSLKDADRPEVTLTLLEMVEVLAIDRNILPGQSPAATPGLPATVTLGVTPEQAKALKAVEDRGELSLALRHPDDNGSVVPASVKSSEKVTVDQLIGARPEKKTASIEIYNGGQKTEFTFNVPVKEDEDDLNRIETPIRPETSIAVLSAVGEGGKKPKDRKRNRKNAREVAIANAEVVTSSEKNK